MINKQLMNEAKKSRTDLSLTIGLGLASGLLVILQASGIARVVNGVFLGDQSFRQVQDWLLLIFGVILLRALIAWLSEVFAQRTAAAIKEDLRQRLLAHVFSLGPLYARGEKTGELVNVLNEGIENVDAYFSRYIPQLALSALVPLSIIGFVFPLDWISGLIMLLTAPLIPMFMVLIGKLATALSQKQWETLSRMSAHFLDVLQGMTTLKLFDRSKHQISVIARVSEQFRLTTLGVVRVAFLSALTLELLSTLSTALVAVGLGLRLVYGQIQFEQAFFILLLAPEFYLPLRTLGTQFHAGMTGSTAAKRIFEILDTPIQRELNREGSGALDPIGPHEAKGLDLSLKGLSYTYPGGEKVLQNLFFRITSGEKVVLVGTSGAGKSTLASVLLRLLKPQEGEINVQGKDWQEMTSEAWRRWVAYVPQHPHLFYGTVAENIRFSRPEASGEEIIEAARQAGAHEFISRLPHQYDTLVGEGGEGLSGGQIQRLAVARAFLKKASFLILDEATANLDQKSEEWVQESVAKLGEACSVLIIAHRLEWATRADRILVLEQGRIAEEGTYADLIENEGPFAKLLQAYGGVL